MQLLIALMVFVFLVLSCATLYQKHSFWGVGVSEVQPGENIF